MSDTETIFTELTSDGSEVRADYLNLFEDDVKVFSDAMGQAYSKWRSLDAHAGRKRETSMRLGTGVHGNKPSH